MAARGIYLSLLAVCIGLPSVASAGRDPDPTRFELFAHADVSASEAGFYGAVRGWFMTMDPPKPEADIPKSAGLTNAGPFPTRRCVGNPYFPVWATDIGGRIKGEVVFEFFVVSSPGGRVDVLIWPDVDVTGCQDHYRPPSARTTVTLPSGSGRVVARMNDVDFEAANNIIIQLSPRELSPTQGRVLFDARSTPTSLTFECTPLWGDVCASYD